MITGRTRVYTILAHPSTHVIAPGVFNRLFSLMDLDMVYIAHDIPAGAVKATIKAFASWENLGGLQRHHTSQGGRGGAGGMPRAHCKDHGRRQHVVRHENGAFEGYNTDGTVRLRPSAT
jgi:shikimate 5-dehydrogenase